MQTVERRHPLEVMECLLRDIEYLRVNSKFKAYSIPLLETLQTTCENFSSEVEDMIKEKSNPILIKDTPHGLARLNDK